MTKTEFDMMLRYMDEVAKLRAENKELKAKLEMQNAKVAERSATKEEG